MATSIALPLAPGIFYRNLIGSPGSPSGGISEQVIGVEGSGIDEH